MAMKCVAQIPHPVAAPAVTVQIARVLPPVARARWKREIAARLAKKQTIPARMTSRQSCSPVRQVSTRYILISHSNDPKAWMIRYPRLEPSFFDVKGGFMHKT